MDSSAIKSYEPQKELISNYIHLDTPAKTVVGDEEQLMPVEKEFCTHE